MAKTHIHTCRHIRTNGTTCRGAALRGKPFCFFHERTQLRERRLLQQPALPADTALPAPVELDFPTLEDADAVQVALSLVACSLAANQLEPRRAGVLLYALQLASMNLRSTRLDFEMEEAVVQFALSEDGVEISA
jgi:hypothetical protein